MNTFCGFNGLPQWYGPYPLEVFHQIKVTESGRDHIFKHTIEQKKNTKNTWII